MHHSNAKALAQNMQDDGFSCYIEPVNNIYRVRHGNFASLEEAKQARQKLFDKGYEARVIEHR